MQDIIYLNMFILPFIIFKYNFEIISIIDWLYNKLRNNEIKIKPLNKNTVINDNCLPKASGNYFFDKVPTILNILNTEIIEIIEPECFHC